MNLLNTLSIDLYTRGHGCLYKIYRFDYLYDHLLESKVSGDVVTNLSKYGIEFTTVLNGVLSGRVTRLLGNGVSSITLHCYARGMIRRYSSSRYSKFNFYVLSLKEVSLLPQRDNSSKMLYGVIDSVYVV